MQSSIAQVTTRIRTITLVHPCTLGTATSYILVLPLLRHPMRIIRLNHQLRQPSFRHQRLHLCPSRGSQKPRLHMKHILQQLLPEILLRIRIDIDTLLMRYCIV